MRLISKALEEELHSIEVNRHNIGKARYILEKAITKQMQLLTIALYSSELLNGRELQQNDLAQINTICLSLFQNVPINTDEDTASFVADSIYNKRWPTICLADLVNVELRIIGRYVYLWNTIDINEQLAMLGSSYRLFFAGAMQLATSQVKRVVGCEDKSGSLDCRYIWGKIGPISISLGGPVFDFVTETVASPFFEDNTPGFSIGDTAIIRRVVVKENHQTDDGAGIFILFHEILHTISYSYKEGSPFTLSNWDLYIKRDLCRYLINPHQKEEIEETFKLLQEPALLAFIQQDSTGILKQLTPFSKLLDDLLSSQKIVMDGSGFYLCKVYQEEQPWDVF